ncbi:MAG: DUF4199 family protein [Chitinophagaceae bacterium]|nr:DUF4199 family protein [Chitinophagaceae bacterium]
MKKAIITGFITGVIISGIMIGGTYLRRFLPHTFTANLLFITFFFGSIVSILWLSLNYYCKNSVVRMKSLSVTGIISSVIAALLVSLHSFMYSRFNDPGYIDEILQFSKQKWQKTNAAAESFIGNWTWLAPNFVWNNFRDLVILLVITTLFIVVIYYLRNKNRIPYSRKKENHELIY